MRSMRFMFAALSLLACAVPAFAGWDNVFQPTLFGRWRQQPPRTSNYYYVPPAVVHSSPIAFPPVVSHSAPCDPCQQTPCTTRYIQRSYYQPITTMETREVKELVTSYRTSYYYEPITTMRYSSYYDPCSCSYHQVATPSVSYQLREQKCPVQSWVSRCVQVPVQGVQKVDYWQPVTTCCTTTMGQPIIGSGPPPQMPPAANMTAPPPGDGPPSITGNKTPGTGTSKPGTMWEQYYPPLEKIPEIRGNTTPGASFQPQLGAPQPIQPPAGPVPPVKMDRIAVGPNSLVEGQVVRSDTSPKAGAKVLFVNAATGQQLATFANGAGRFQTELAAGSWHVYLHGANDLPIYHSRIDVAGAKPRQVQLVSRTN